MNYKNARPYSQPNAVYNPILSRIPPLPGKSKFIEARVNQGMITMLDPADIPPGALQLCRNARCRFDRTTRRPGTKLLTPTKPNSNRVLGTFFFKKNDGSTFFFRFTPTTIHFRDGVSWTPITAGVGATLTGGATDRFQAVVAFDRFIYTNGVDILHYVDVTDNKFKKLGNAPSYKYITAFFNRVVGANRTGLLADATQVGWSAEGGITGVGLDEWDPLVDETAGSSPLVDSPSDRADYISGLFGFTNVMIVLREQSVWLATKQPIPTNPFFFYTAFPGLGSNCPESAVITLNGITWVDQRSGSVWFYEPGGKPEPIGRSIERDLMRGLDDPSQVFASYAPIEQEYTVCIPQVSGAFVTAWTFNFRTNAWARDEYEAISSIDDVDLSESIITIDDLGDIPIDQLNPAPGGTIDDLSPASPIIPVRTFGRTDGEIIIENPNPDPLNNETDTDPVFPSDPLSTGVYTTELISKSYTMPTDDIYIAEIRIELVPRRAGDLTLTYSKDGGETFSAASKTRVIASAELDKPRVFKWVKQIKARRFAWRLVTQAGQCDIIGYEVHVYKSGESKQ